MKNMLKKLKNLGLCLSLISVLLDITVCYGMTGTTGKKRNHELSLGENSSEQEREKEREEERELAKRKRTGDQDTVSGETAGFSGGPWAGSVTGTGPEYSPKASFMRVLPAETAVPAGETEETKDFLETKSETKHSAQSDDDEEEASAPHTSTLVPSGEAAASVGETKEVSICGPCYSMVGGIAGRSFELFSDEKDSDSSVTKISDASFGACEEDPDVINRQSDWPRLIVTPCEDHVLTHASGAQINAHLTGCTALSDSRRYLAYGEIQQKRLDLPYDGEHHEWVEVLRIVDIHAKKDVYGDPAHQIIVRPLDVNARMVQPDHEFPEFGELHDFVIKKILFVSDDQMIIVHSEHMIFVLKFDAKAKKYIFFDEHILPKTVRIKSINVHENCLVIADSLGRITAYTCDDSGRFFSSAPIATILRKELSKKSRIHLFFLSDTIIQIRSSGDANGYENIFFDLSSKHIIQESDIQGLTAIKKSITESYQEKFTETDITVKVMLSRLSTLNKAGFQTVLSRIDCYRGSEKIGDTYCEIATYKILHDGTAEKVNQLEGVFSSDNDGISLKYVNDHADNNIITLENIPKDADTSDSIIKIFDGFGLFCGYAFTGQNTRFRNCPAFDRDYGVLSSIVQSGNMLILNSWTLLDCSSQAVINHTFKGGSCPGISIRGAAGKITASLRAREACYKVRGKRLDKPWPYVSIEIFIASVKQDAGHAGIED